jgi:hypothetical protein
MFRTVPYLRHCIHAEEQRRLAAVARADVARRRPPNHRAPHDVVNAQRVAEDATQRIERLEIELNDLIRREHAA